MAPSSFSDDSNDDERDDTFKEDMEALKRACILSGKDSVQLEQPSSASAASNSKADDSDENDDLELFRSIHQRFSLPSSVASPPIPNSHAFLSMDDSDSKDDFETLRAIQRRFSHYDDSDSKDDFETLRAIQRRFSHYDGDGLTNNEICKHQLVSTTRATPEDNSNILQNRISSETLRSFQPSESCDTGPGHPSNSSEWSKPEDVTHNLSLMPLDNATFPKSAQMFIAAIKKNRLCQKLVRNKLIQIETMIENNKALKERLKCLMDLQASFKRKEAKLLSKPRDLRIKLISLPNARNSDQISKSKVKDKKTSALHFGPVENSHVLNYRMVLTKFPISLSRQPWSKTEKENLAMGIKQQFQEVMLQKSMEHYGDAEGSFGGLYDVDNIIASIKNFEITPEKIRSFLPQVDWNRLASMYIMGRSGAECETRWLNHEDPLINHNPWTNLEDKKLLFILQQRGIYNWIEIAISLGTNRTPFQCLARYQRSLNAYILKRDWTEDEDAQLRAVVETLGENNWQAVATALGGRTGPQCSNRWRKSLHPSRQRVGRWSVDEDNRLKIAVMLFGQKRWNRIADFVPGRTQVQCRERWFNSLDPSLKWGKWTEEEDSRLEAAIAEHGYCWSKIAACFSGRTDNQCRRRWKILFPHEVPLLQAARKIQRVALISNFVDREELRPALGPSDFVPLLETNSLSEAGNENSKPKRSDELQLNRSKKAGAKAKTDSMESSRATNVDHVDTSHANNDNPIRKKRTKKVPSKAYPNRAKGVEELERHGDLTQPEATILNSVDSVDATSDFNSRTKGATQECKSKKPRIKRKLAHQKDFGEVELGDEMMLSSIFHSKDAAEKSKFNKSRTKCKVALQENISGVEYDDDATLAFVLHDIVKRRKLKFRCTEIVPDTDVNSFPVKKNAIKQPYKSDACNQLPDDQVQLCPEGAILGVTNNINGYFLNGTSTMDYIPQQDAVRKSSAEEKTADDENLRNMHINDTLLVDHGVGVSSQDETILVQNRESQLCGHTIGQPLPCEMDPHLLQILSLPTETIAADRSVDTENCFPPSSDSNRRLDNSFHVDDGETVDKSSDVFLCNEPIGAGESLALLSLNGIGSFEADVTIHLNPHAEEPSTSLSLEGIGAEGTNSIFSDPVAVTGEVVASMLPGSNADSTDNMKSRII